MTIAKLKAAYARFIATKAGAIVNRVVVAGAGAFTVTFMAQAVEVHLFAVPGFFNLALWHVVVAAALYAGGAAALALVQSILTAAVLGAPQLQARNRAVFQAKRAELGLAA